MNATFDDRDVDSVLSGAFDINAKLAELLDEVRVIRWLLEDDEEEEEEDDPDGLG